MKKIFIVDAVNFIFRSYFAIGPMTNARGESTNALYGFIRSINKIIKDFNPDHLVAVFDGPNNKARRKEIYSEYKAQRAAAPADLFSQIEKAIQLCEIGNIPNLCVPNAEADDVIGAVTKWAEAKGAEVIICSSDKDLCQLVSENVFVLNPHKNNLMIDTPKVVELFGVKPDQIVDLLAIMGDSSDNIPGLEGFGPKTAADLLTKHGTLDYILAHPEVLTGKKQETVIRDKEIALLSRKLAELHYDVEFPKNEEFYKLKPPQLEKLSLFYHENNFTSLLREIEPPPALEKEELNYHLVDDEEELQKLIALLERENEVCIDTETTDIRPMFARLVGVGLGLKAKTAWYVPLNGKLGRVKVLEALKPLLENPKIGFYGHNIKYDIHVFLNEGIKIANICFDTILASYLIAPQNQKHSLDELAFTKFNKTKIPIEDLIGKGKKQITMDQVPIASVSTYCCEDIDYTCRLKNVFDKEIDKLELRSLLEAIEIPLIPVLVNMERRGIYADIPTLSRMSVDLSTKIKELEKTIYELAGETFNLNSPKQLSVVLFEKMQIHAPKKTATGFSTAADVLESLQDAHPIIKYILEYRGLEKLRSTYVDSLPEQIFPETGRIHCTFNQTVAATGRLSCQDPNLQNIPIRTEIGRRVRSAFMPQSPGTCYVAADYSQIELRLLAHLSNDPSLIAAFQEGEDVHAYTASLIFNVSLKEVTPEMRHRAKAVNFGIIYGQQAFGLSQGLDIGYAEAAEFIETYFQRYSKVKEYFEFCKESVRKTGRALTLTGRQRPIPEINSKNPILRAQAERFAMNTPLQGTAADLIKIAMIQLEESLSGSLILQIHDELLFEVPDEKAEVVAAHVKKVMEGVFSLKVPLVVDISIGKNWAEC